MMRRLLPYGDLAVLLECADLDETLGLFATLQNHQLDEISEIIPGARTLLLRLLAPLSATSESVLLTASITRASQSEQDLLTLEVSYDGEDLDEVAGLLGITAADVVAAHTAQVWTVGFCGFAPGFAYLVGENDALTVPRRSSPRKRVPAGAVGLADRWSGVYPREGPGGWQLIGSTDAPMWDLERDPPALLQPGHRVQFRQRTRP